MPPISLSTGILNKIRAWCDSWVMLDEQNRFVPLPGEQILFTSPPRTTLALQTPNSYPGKEPLAINSSGGVAFLTNQRVSNSLLYTVQIFLLPTDTPFSSSIYLLHLHLNFSHSPHLY